MTAAPGPVAALLDAWDDSSLYPAALRAGLLPYLHTLGPCVAVRTRDGARAWAVAGHRALREAALRPRDFSGELLGTAMGDPSPEEAALLRLQLPGLPDGPHARMRRGLSAPLRTDIARGLSERVREAAAARTATAARTAAADLVRDVVVPVVADALGELLGVPQGLREEFRSWCVDSSEMTADPEAEERALRAFLHLCARLRRHRTARPADDLPTALATRLTSSPAEFALNWVLLVKAGFGATVSAGAQLLRALPGDGAAAGGLPALLDDTLRRHPPILQARRTAARPTVLAGQDIAAGERVLLVFAAPGHGPGPVPHTAFGHGRHACPGAPWARALLTGLAEGAAPAAARWHLPDTASAYATSFSQGLRTLPAEPDSRCPGGAGPAAPAPAPAAHRPADPRSTR
ncbi:hypothetical protein ACIGN6_30800 [Streptomyces sp. NPDC053792]|uniref:hypothetical protein n=1 Tax=Streptomyces sp. NPDC053792 TaxID=3365716 RepID=UPI0037CD8D6B